MLKNKKIKETIIAIFMVCLLSTIVFNNIIFNVIASDIVDSNNIDTSDNCKDNKIIIKDVKDVVYKELFLIKDFDLNLKILCAINNIFDSFEDFGITPDMTVEQATEIINNQITKKSLKNMQNLQSLEITPEVELYYFFITINVNFGVDEGFLYKEGRKLRVFFEPNDVTSSDSYLEIKTLLGQKDRYPINDPNWPVQRYDTYIRLFFGNAYSSNGRIIVNGFGFFVTLYMAWHKH